MTQLDVVVIKCNSDGIEVWRYSGSILKREADAVVIEARFNRDDLLFNGMLLERDDRFVEIYYTNRWYNIFEIHDHLDDHLKGWYCNVTRPAQIVDGMISYIDLALDLLVFPDGRQLVLDEDEFEVLQISTETRQKALAAIEELKQVLKSPQTLFPQPL